MERVRFLVKEKGKSGVLYVGHDVRDCLNFIDSELWKRNERDGFDEHWHNCPLVIEKEITITSIVVDI